MSENPYTRTVTTTVTELVPERGQLPKCGAWLWQRGGGACGNRAKYLQDGRPVCGTHLGRPSLIFVPVEAGRP